MAKSPPFPTHGGPITQEFDEFAEKVISELHCAGLSVSWSDENGTVATGYGFAEIASTKADANTVYATASTTKSFTAMSVLRLIQDSQSTTTSYSLQTTLKSILGDDFVLQNEELMNSITLENALTHTSGMPNHDSAIAASSNPREETRRLRHFPTFESSARGKKFDYNNQMYVAVSQALETATSQPLGTYMSKNIWQPLGMKATFYNVDDALAAEAAGAGHVARPYFWDTEKKQFEEQRFERNAANAGDGAIISSVSDYALYLCAMLSQSPALLSAENFTQLRTPRIRAGENAREEYALGWEVTQYHGETIIAHDGATHGFNSRMLYVPSRGWTFAAMGNVEERASGAIYAVCYRLLDDALGLPRQGRMDRIAKWYSLEDKDLASWKEAKEELFPGVQEEGERSERDLERFVGRYVHPGYGAIEFAVADSPDWWLRPMERVLRAEVYQREFAHVLTLEHVAGHDYIARYTSPPFQRILGDQYYKAGFRVDGSEVKAFGIQYAEALEELIWFERQDDVLCVAEGTGTLSLSD